MRLIDPRDLQTEWAPSTFEWGVARLPVALVYGPGGQVCGCLGPQTEAQKAAKLCPCDWQRRYGVERRERFLLPRLT